MGFDQGTYLEVRAVTAAMSVGDKLVFTPGQPVDIVRIGAIWTVTAAQAGSSCTIALDKRITAGSDTGRVNAVAAQTLVIPGAVGPGASSLAGNVNTKSMPPYPIDPGEEAVLEVLVALATAGSAALFIQYQQRAFQVGRIAHVIQF